MIRGNIIQGFNANKQLKCFLRKILLIQYFKLCYLNLMWFSIIKLHFYRFLSTIAYFKKTYTEKL